MKYHDKFEPETFYHIYNHAVGNENLFRSNENFRYFLKKYDEYTNSILETYAYCLMPNHFHFLVKIRPLEELQKLPKFSANTHGFVMQKFSNLFNAYAKAYNRRYERRGALFLDFTKRIAIKDDTYFKALINYIHQNPVHHGFSKTPDEWEFSSYQACLSEMNSKIKRAQVLEWFGNKAAFQQYHQENWAVLPNNFEIN